MERPKVVIDVGGCEMRTAIKTTIYKDSESLTVLGTHLDHLSETKMLAQLEILKPSLEDVYVIAGNFNSLYFDDYDEVERFVINNKRIKCNLEYARYDLMNKIKVDLGYVIPKRVENTSRFMTRVDYICCKDTFHVVNHNIEDTLRLDYSDHNMVLMSIKKSSK